jgi:pyridoxamine 5'-phosphate oxidase
MEAPPFADPLVALVTWHREAVDAGALQPDAMTLATSALDGRPSARIVLFKGVAEGGVQFATNYASRKGREIEANPHVALVFYWSELARQIRIEGLVTRASSAASDAYFQSRPRESQLAAWASSQSEPLVSRAELLARFADAEARFHERAVERPPGWGLYSVTPELAELWVSAPHRLHDRFAYERRAGGWSVRRLSP